MNIENTTFSEQFRNSIEKSLKEATSMPLAHKYMIAHFLSLVQAPQEKEQPQYSWNIVESGAKHHNPDHPTLSIKSEGVKLV
jgi:hypothetical protein